MPKRSNRDQAIIYYVKRHFAPPEVQVTESMMVFDPAADEYREVDVVMEGAVGDESVCISVEVVSRSRKMGPDWVGSMVSKHERMATTKLVLVSWSGFTRGAESLVDSLGGWVVALTPEPVPNASVPPPFYMEVSTTPRSASIWVHESDGSVVKVNGVPLDLNIYAAPDAGAFVGTLRDVILRQLNGEPVGKELLDLAYNTDERSALNAFTLEYPDLSHRSLYIHDGDGDCFLRLSGFAATGEVALREQSLHFTVMRLGESLFAVSEGEMAGRPAVWVLTKHDADTATLSWRLL